MSPHRGRARDSWWLWTSSSAPHTASSSGWSPRAPPSPPLLPRPQTRALQVCWIILFLRVLGLCVVHPVRLSSASVVTTCSALAPCALPNTPASPIHIHHTHASRSVYVHAYRVMHVHRRSANALFPHFFLPPESICPFLPVESMEIIFTT